MIDERGRLFGKINIFDFLFLLVLVIVAGKVAYDKLHVQEIVAPPQDTVYLEFKAEVLSPVGEQVAVGQKVYDKRTGVYLGEVQAVEVKPVPVPVASPTGEVLWVDSPRNQEVRLRLVNQGTVTENVYQLGPLGVRVGERLTLNGPQFSLDAILTALSKGQ